VNGGSGAGKKVSNEIRENKYFLRRRIMSKRMRGEMVMIGIVLAFALMILPGSALSAAKEPIRVGFITPVSGTFAADGEFMRNGFSMYLEKVNYEVAGRKIEVIDEDDKADPRTGLIKARRLVEEKQVHMVAGVMASNVAYAIKDYVVSNKVPFIITNAGADDLTSRDFSPYVFRSSFSNSEAGHAFGDWAYKKGYRRLTILTSDYSAGYEHIGSACKVFKDAGGEIVEEIYAPLGCIDFAPYLSRISADKTDGVVCFLAGVDSLNAVKQFAQYGLKGKVALFALGSFMEHLIPEMGDAALGAIDCHHYMPSYNLTSKEHLEFVNTFKKKYNRPVNFVCEGSYVGAQLIVKALESIQGNVEDTNAFMKALETVNIVAPRGPVKLDQYHNPVHNEYISVLKKKGNDYYYEIMETYPNVSQFWKWSPEEFIKMPAYKDMKGKWATRK
jgi:branched-chain amino acid transport system substrate-binding protein